MTHTVEVEAMGTVVAFLVAEGTNPGALAGPRQELERLEALLSPYRSTSEVARYARRERFTPGPELAEVLGLCEEARDLSDGLFDPWALPGGFDPSGLAKGWIVERVLVHCLAADVEEIVIEAGGDVVVASATPESVGIRHPRDPHALAAVVSVDAAVATSGCYERGPHLVHPRGGSVAATSATIVGGPLWLADAMATAVCIGGAPALARVCRRTGLTGFVTTTDDRLVAFPGTPLLVPSTL